MTDLAFFSAEDLMHAHHAWQQAEDGEGIDRRHLNACVRLGFMQKVNRRRWEFTPAGEAVANAIDALWQVNRFDPVTGEISAEAAKRPASKIEE